MSLSTKHNGQIMAVTCLRFMHCILQLLEHQKPTPTFQRPAEKLYHLLVSHGHHPSLLHKEVVTTIAQALLYNLLRICPNHVWACHGCLFESWQMEVVTCYKQTCMNSCLFAQMHMCLMILEEFLLRSLCTKRYRVCLHYIPFLSSQCHSD